MLAGERVRHCPRCGLRVAQQAQTCLLCGYELARGPVGAGGSGWWIAGGVAVVALIAGVMVAALRERGLARPNAGSVTVPSAGSSIALAAPPTATVAIMTSEPATALPVASPTRTETPTPLPTETPTPEPTATPTTGPRVHIVQKGDVLSSIALQYGVSIEDILAANPGLTERSILSIGQEIVIPPANRAPEAPAGTPEPQYVVHVVEQGDTLLYIATKYGTTVEAIIAANPGLTEKSILRVGQEIRVPAPAGSSGGAEQQEPTATPAGTPVAEARAAEGATVTPTASLLSLGGPAQPRALESLSPRGDVRVRAAELFFNWTGVGELPPDHYYVVHVWPAGRPGDMLIGWTKANSWRPAEDLLARWGEGAHLRWDVGIERQILPNKGGMPQFEPAGPRTDPQDFYLVP